MKNDVEHYCVRFHERAREIFFPLYNSFTHLAKALDRQGDENVFQQLLAKYISELNSRLQAVAAEMMAELSLCRERNEFNSALHSLIGDYTKEFIQKANSL